MRGIGRRKSWRRSGRWQLRAAATVEMAIVTPILLGMVFGIIEYGWVFMVQSSLTSAARDACRVGILPGATDGDINQRFAEAIEPAGLVADGGGGTGYTLEIQRVPTGQNMQTLTVRARVPWDQVSLVGGGILPSPGAMLGLLSHSDPATPRTSDMVASCSMLMEGTLQQ